MGNIIVVSKCIKCLITSSAKKRYTFHFKGVFAGEILKEISLLGEDRFKVEVGEEYLIYVAPERTINSTLYGRILKLKLLSDCWDQS